MTYKITVRRRTRDICCVYCLSIAAIKEALRELVDEYPTCFFVLKGVHTCNTR
jgi:hypothetical protein